MAATKAANDFREKMGVPPVSIDIETTK